MELQKNRGFRGSYLAFAEDIKDEETRKFIIFLSHCFFLGKGPFVSIGSRGPASPKYSACAPQSRSSTNTTLNSSFSGCFWKRVQIRKPMGRGGRGLLFVYVWFFGFPVSSTSRLPSEQILQKLTCAAHQVIIPQTSRHQHSKGRPSRHGDTVPHDVLL